ncbi:MAG: NlpC/P60 family protein [Thermomicrobiales bacterium]
MSRLARKVAVLLLVGIMFAGSVPAVSADTDLNVGGIAIVANTGGDAVMVREGPGYDYTVLTDAIEGDILTVLDGPIQGDDGNYWYKINLNDTVGYIFADFLVLPENAPLHPNRSAAAENHISTAEGYVTSIGNTGGDGVRMRDSAELDGGIVLVIPDGESVTVIGDPRSADGYTWYPISYAGASGWVAGDFLGGSDGGGGGSSSGGGGGTVQAAAAAKPVPVLEVGAHVAVGGTGGEAVRIRETYGLDGAIYGAAPEGAVLKVVGSPESDDAGNIWYPVSYAGVSGFVIATYISWTDAPLSQQAATPDPAPAAAPAAAPPPQPEAAPAPKAAAPAPPPAPADTGHGQAIVNVAMKYLGYPYVWAGASPGGFDCSGFTMYVVQKALGINITHDLSVQIGMGSSVNAKNLQPGDLVFYQNTYEPGLSHVGIYIGGGQMIHAGSESTGVVISDMWNSYWSPKYLGARRL